MITQTLSADACLRPQSLTTCSSFHLGIKLISSPDTGVAFCSVEKKQLLWHQINKEHLSTTRYRMAESMSYCGAQVWRGPSVPPDPHQVSVLRQSLHLAYEFNISGRSQNKMVYGYITGCFIGIPTTISGW